MGKFKLHMLNCCLNQVITKLFAHKTVAETAPKIERCVASFQSLQCPVLARKFANARRSSLDVGLIN